MDTTSQKIIDATMVLLRDKGYMATTTKDIAQAAGVNECTLFRKFKNKKDIVLSGIKQVRWRADVTPELFSNVRWNLQKDLEMFMRVYMEKITPDFVRLSIGLRAPQIYEETAPLIMEIPTAFISSLVQYFKDMQRRKQIESFDFETTAMQIFSSTFGYTFLKASFQDHLTNIDQETYIRNSVETLLKGIPQT